MFLYYIRSERRVNFSRIAAKDQGRSGSPLISPSRTDPRSTIDGSNVITVPRSHYQLEPGAASTSFEETEENDDDDDDDDNVESLIVHRLPGETLGMEVDIKRPLGHDSRVYGVFVSGVHPGGPAEMASGGTRGICVGDEILRINGTQLRDMSHTEAVQIFNEMPLRITVVVKRGPTTAATPPPFKDRQTSMYSVESVDDLSGNDLENDPSSPSSLSGDEGGVYQVHPLSAYALQTRKASIRHEGFELRKIVFKKHVSERLGLQIEPVEKIGRAHV